MLDLPVMLPTANYREAPLYNTGHRPPEKPGTANFIFTADDNNIRTEVRYRIYDFCFDIQYDSPLRPSVMQYMHVVFLPPHPLFDYRDWKNTRVNRHWSHEPRGLALLRVCSSIHREAFFRFYWFHLPNWLVPDSDLPALRRRLSKIPKPHGRNVNAQLKFYDGLRNDKEPDSSGPMLIPATSMSAILRETGLGRPSAPWVEHINLDGVKEKVILGVGFQILAEMGQEDKVAALSFVGKLGNMVFRREVDRGPDQLDFTASTGRATEPLCSPSPGSEQATGIYDVFRRIHHHLENAVGGIKRARTSVSALQSPNSEHLPRVTHLENRQPYPTATSTAGEQYLPAEKILRASPALAPEGTDCNPSTSGRPAVPGYAEDRLGTPPSPRHDCRLTFSKDGGGQARGGDLLGLLHDLSCCTLDLIKRLEHDAMVRLSPPGGETELLTRDESKPILPDLGNATPDGFFHVARNISNPVSGPCRPAAAAKKHEERQVSASQEIHGKADGLKTDPQGPSSSKTACTWFQTQTEAPSRCGSASHLAHLDHGSIRLGSARQQQRVHRPRDSSFEARIAHWITRENDPISSRKPSATWSDGKEALELSSRKRVSSTNYHSCLSRHSSSQKPCQSSSTAVQSSQSSSSSSSSSKSLFRPISTNVPALNDAKRSAPQASKAATVTATNDTPAVAVPASPFHWPQTERSTPTVAAEPADSPPLSSRALPANGNGTATNMQTATPAAAAATSRRIRSSGSAFSTSSRSSPSALPSSSSISAPNAASLCVGSRNCSGVADVEPAAVVVPGARQFLTPKRNVKPWWESGSVGGGSGGGSSGDDRDGGEGRGCRSTGGKTRKKEGKKKAAAAPVTMARNGERQRETRGSASSWLSLE